MRRLLRSIVFVVAAVCVLGAPRRANSSPFTDHFEDVRAKLVALRDGYVEPLGSADAKRKAALEKLLGAIDAVSTSFRTDLATAKRIAATAAKPLLDDPELPGVVADLLRALAGDVDARVGALDAALESAAPSSARTRAELLLAKARTALATASGAASQADLRSAARALVRAEKTALALASAVQSAQLASVAACSDLPQDGAQVFATTGSGTVLDSVASVDAITPRVSGPPYFVVRVGSGIGETSFQIEIPGTAADLHVGTVTVQGQSFVSVHGSDAVTWDTRVGMPTTARVVAESADRVTLCIDAKLRLRQGSESPTAKIRVRGYVVVAR